MGLLTVGQALNWEETQKLKDFVKKHGIQQFIHLYRSLKNEKKNEFKWGDEVECMLVHFDHENKIARLALNAVEALEKLQEAENEAIKQKTECELNSLWRPEFAAFMIESSPGQPFVSSFNSFNEVENNMRRRREEANAVLPENVSVMTFTAFPRLGCPDFTRPPSLPTPQDQNSAMRSIYFPDECIYPGHARFITIAKHVVLRRGEKPIYNVPIFVDTNTPRPFIDDVVSAGGSEFDRQSLKLDHVYLDTEGFGASCCCLQVTFQCHNADEARLLYDQLIVLCPIMMTLTAGSPVFKGFLIQTDCRWAIESATLDDRTPDERGLEPLQDGHVLIPKSRFDSVDSYLSESGDKYNDIKLPINEESYKDLLDAGVDEILARHIAHLFVRDPLLILSDRVDLDDEKDTDHFEGIQSTNWQTMRFKPSPGDSEMGCRVEFRPMEVQISDFENAAFVTFMILLTRVILTFDVNLLIPISKVEKNMKESQKIDAVTKSRFFFRNDILPESTSVPFYQKYLRFLKKEYTEMSINEIINGKAKEFPGLIPLVKDYLKSVDLDVETNSRIQTYLRFISKRAAGDLKTPARWIRDFVDQHPSYQHDSVVSEEVNYDLMSACKEIADGKLRPPDLLPEYSEGPGEIEVEHDWTL